MSRLRCRSSSSAESQSYKEGINGAVSSAGSRRSLLTRKTTMSLMSMEDDEKPGKEEERVPTPPPPYSEHDTDITVENTTTHLDNAGRLREDCACLPAFLKRWPVLTIFLVMGFNGLMSMMFARIFVALEGPAQSERLLSKELTKREMEDLRRNLDVTLKFQAGSFNANKTLALLTNYSIVLAKYVSFKDEIKWDMLSGSAFVTAISSTTGYGDIVAVTPAGRFFAVAYALYGIPVFVWYIVKLGLLFRAITIRVFCYLKNSFRLKFESKTSMQIGLKNVVIAVSGPAVHVQLNIGQELQLEKRFHPCVIGVILLIYLLSVASFISYMEGYTYFDSFYASFITYATIGFGDIDIYRISYRANWFTLMCYGNCIHIVGYTLVSAWVSSIIEIFVIRH